MRQAQEWEEGLEAATLGAKAQIENLHSLETYFSSVEGWVCHVACYLLTVLRIQAWTQATNNSIARHTNKQWALKPKPIGNLDNSFTTHNSTDLDKMGYRWSVWHKQGIM